MDVRLDDNNTNAIDGHKEAEGKKTKDMELAFDVLQKFVPDRNRACLLWCHEQYIILTTLCLGLNSRISLSTSKVLGLDASLF